ncbi:MAG: MerR family transcriptional regulator [Bacteroidetes bacterium]|nr:MerR family transcriptional regulator [Bacteroidota bacterium]
MEKEEIQKLYYSISEVSEMFDLNASTLRFWEKEFTGLRPTKNKKGNRLFTQKDIDHIAKIVDLVKHRGFTIQGAKEQLKHKSKAADSHQEVIKRLQEIKAKLLDMDNNL